MQMFAAYTFKSDMRVPVALASTGDELHRQLKSKRIKAADCLIQSVQVDIRGATEPSQAEELSQAEKQAEDHVYEVSQLEESLRDANMEASDNEAEADKQRERANKWQACAEDLREVILTLESCRAQDRPTTPAEDRARDATMQVFSALSDIDRPQTELAQSFGALRRK